MFTSCIVAVTSPRVHSAATLKLYLLKYVITAMIWIHVDRELDTMIFELIFSISAMFLGYFQ